jgi:hypothetical protein
MQTYRILQSHEISKEKNKIQKSHSAHAHAIETSTHIEMVIRGQGANRVANLQRKRPELLRDHSGSQVFELLITGRVHMCVMVSANLANGPAHGTARPDKKLPCLARHGPPGHAKITGRAVPARGLAKQARARPLCLTCRPAAR